VLAASPGCLAWRQSHASQHRAVSDLNARVVLVGDLLDSLVQGGIDTLQATASAPPVQDQRTDEMSAYFRRVHASAGTLFNSGIGWLDRSGALRASTTRPHPNVNLSYRDYFKRVVATKRPYVSSGLISVDGAKPTVVVAVPTFDRRGRLTGVLTGGILLQPNQMPSALR